MMNLETDYNQAMDILKKHIGEVKSAVTRNRLKMESGQGSAMLLAELAAQETRLKYLLVTKIIMTRHHQALMAKYSNRVWS